MKNFDSCIPLFIWGGQTTRKPSLLGSRTTAMHDEATEQKQFIGNNKSFLKTTRIAAVTNYCSNLNQNQPSARSLKSISLHLDISYYQRPLQQKNDTKLQVLYAVYQKTIPKQEALRKPDDAITRSVKSPNRASLTGSSKRLPANEELKLSAKSSWKPSPFASETFSPFRRDTRQRPNLLVP